MILISENFGGNIHSAVHEINKMGLADFVLTMQSDGRSTQVVFRMSREDAKIYFPEKSLTLTRIIEEGETR